MLKPLPSACADANPAVVAAFAIANIVGKVAGRPGSGGFGAFRHRMRRATNAGGSGASNPGWTPRTGTTEPTAQALRHAHRRRLLRIDGTVCQGRSRAGRQRLSTQTAVSRPIDPRGNGNGNHSLCSSGG